MLSLVPDHIYGNDTFQQWLFALVHNASSSMRISQPATDHLEVQEHKDIPQNRLSSQTNNT